MLVVTNVISIICLAWTLHGANLGELRREIVHLDWRWAMAGMVFGVLVYAIQAWRWQLVLKPVDSIPLWDFIRSIYIGLFANEVIPLRAGEIIRCYLLSKWGDIPVSVSLASALIERIFDGIWLVACLFLTSRYVHLPREFVAGGYFLVALLVVCGALVGLAMFWKQPTLDYILGAKWLSWVHTLIEDLHLIGHSRFLYYAGLVSLPYILLQVLPIYGMLRSYTRLHDVPVYASFVLMVILRLGAVVPQAPGNVGTFNGITVLGLHLFGVPYPVAKRFSIILWAAMTLPLIVVGFVAVVISEVNMGEVHRSARD
ncbi:MAG: flippase-like domain-containing protein, partial [Acidobacteriaceae bacterium]|nr:flippase-like domain-containing protein [Acidobacteriaceae bacterium]